MKKIIVIFLLLCAFPIYAHDTGPSFETALDGYTIDIGYSENAPTTEDTVIFDFNITQEGVHTTFDDVWVRIERKEAVVFATGIYNSEFGGPRLSYRFPTAGSYTIIVRYENDGETLVETTFPLVVTSASSGPFPLPSELSWGLIGLLLGAWGGVVWGRRWGSKMLH
ncbi:MAG: hypothetical protein AAB440_00745 [Patescibacteria group bacterium]